MTNPSDMRSTDDVSELHSSTDPEANPVLGATVDGPSGSDPHEGPTSTMGRGELLRRRFLRNPSAWIGLSVFTLLVLVAIFGPMFYQYGPFERDLRNALTGPSGYHWFGVNENGLDIFARTLQGLRISLVIGLGTAALTSLLALIVGITAGFIGGKGKLGALGDGALVNLINLFLVVPSLLLLMLFSPALQRASWLWMIPLLAGFAWMLTARVLRAMTQQLVRTEYVEAARFMGVNPIITMVRHIIPNVASWIIIDTTLGVSAAILGETGLSFIGFGIQYPQVSLGTVLQDYNISAPYTWMPPAAILAALVISINLMGEALRDALDPTSGSSRL
ncbi:ABC transporter permease [Brachybacterium fresconis]|uniref:Oligopeptide transport system permease protein OppC n=1 Tax=Brachybacterium fresconis TaxID=173363 RepID=A0ABS4YP79_9MICO|nr:ABC transporter permease [Brachybacterium fresconis]MBP2410604.1 ABC-type dipeptide/oligopeptide/nickel transport system permease subunit [Brachybacterium fresconis]